MSNQRMHGLDMPVWRGAALRALDPWWNTPWPPLRQRTYHQARRHVQEHGLLDARGRFPGTSISLGEWLYLQCTRYPDLHPEQQRLLARLGIDAAAARAARPRRRNLRASEVVGASWPRPFLVRKPIRVPSALITGSRDSPVA
ncbi:hypothetical protein Z951_44640 [Streptomyces sp. PRh5]|uniref:helicase associated domain-containing protein n=1 Tax=Streptomyces sp. PRh5 TaxID=1158056 RepID=UPI0004495DF2|nr:helicase associated domain-containing protein [Streptomyces sp. PRh5]EXU61880.1 hypothetical protein Z951_44640 [Streptomyces sp. PRh5]